MSTERSTIGPEARLDALFGGYVDAGQAPGLVYGMVTADGPGHSAGFGKANEAGTAPDADTPFPIASMSKSFTAAAVLIARDRGLLTLDDPITRFIPEFTATGAPEDPCDPPTIRMLLSMSGGLTEDNSWVDPQIDMTEAELLALVRRGLKYSHTPGTVYEYSNVGYALIGIALQRMTGTPFNRFVAEELLTPLGLTSTGFDSESHAPGARADGYSLDPEDSWVPFPPQGSGVFAAAGGIISTVRDLSRWVTWLGEAFRPGHSIGSTVVLSRASRRELQRIESVVPPSVELQPSGTWSVTVGGYGLGLRVEQDLYRGIIVSHSGGLPGFKLHMCWHPDSGYGLVVLTNSHRGDPIALAGEGLAKLLHAENVPSETIRLWPETVAARAIAERLIRQWDDQAAADLFADNVDFDRPLTERRREIEQLIDEVGPLHPSRPAVDIVSAATPADVTWAIPAERGELICMVHLNELDPPQVQEFVVTSRTSGMPRSAAPTDISPRRAGLGTASLSAGPNVRVVLP